MNFWFAWIRTAVRLYDTAGVGAAGHAVALPGCILNKADGVKFTAARAIITQCRAVQLVHHLTARRLVQTVNVLRDHGLALALTLKLCKPQVCGVGLGPVYDELLAVEIIKFRRVGPVKRVGAPTAAVS